MRKTMVMACIWWLAACGAGGFPLADLKPGMTLADVQALFGPRMIRVSGRGGSALYVVVRTADMPGFHPVDERLFLQFRGGRLTGRKGDWEVRGSSVW